MKSLLKLVALVALTATCFTAKAVPLDFGKDLEATDLLGYVPGNVGNTETQIANVINGIAGTTFVAADIMKFPKPAEVSDQFYVQSGYNYLLVQYNGPNGGSAVFGLWGSDAWVPYESAPLWGTNNQYGVSHYALAGPSNRVPDGGTTAALLGAGLLGLSFVARRRLIS